MSSTLIGTQPTVEWWTADPSRTTVEFGVEHFWVLHTVRGRFRRFDGAYVVGVAGPDFELTIDPRASTPASQRVTDISGQPTSSTSTSIRRCGSRRTRVTGIGDGQVRVSGALEAAGTSVPLVFDASVRVIDGELELEATTTVGQRRFGMRQGPFRNVRPPTKLHVKARLVRERPE